MANLLAGIIIGALTFLGQVTVFVAYYSKPELRTPSNYFMFALAIADTAVSTLCIPGWTIQTALGYWPMSYVICDIWIICDYFFTCASIYTVLFITVDRFLAIKFPLKYGITRTPFKTKRTLVIIWFMVFTFCAAFIGGTQYVYGKNRAPNECFAYYLTETKSYHLGFIITTASVWFPTVSATIFYSLVYFDIRRSLRFSSQAMQGRSVGDTQESGQPPALGGEAQASKKSSPKLSDKEMKALRTMSFVLAVFIISCVPLSFVTVSTTLYPESTDPVWLVFGYWMMYLNSTFNPLCYCLGNPAYRTALLDIFCGCVQKGAGEASRSSGTTRPTRKDP